MSERERLVLGAKAKGYKPTDDDTDTDLVWVIQSYRDNASWSSRSSPPAFLRARNPIRSHDFSNACENLEGMLAVLG